MQIAASWRRVCVCPAQALQKIHYFRYALIAVFLSLIFGVACFNVAVTSGFSKSFTNSADLLSKII
jgi:hypothetical protein